MLKDEVEVRSNGAIAVEIHDQARPCKDKEMAAWRAVSQPVYDACLAKIGDMGKAMMDAARGY